MNQFQAATNRDQANVANLNMVTAKRSRRYPRWSRQTGLADHAFSFVTLQFKALIDY